MGKYDISSILLAIGERKAQERARNQALDLEREKMMNDLQFQKARLGLEQTQTEASVRASDATIKTQETLQKKVEAELDMFKVNNPIVPVGGFDKTAKEAGVNLRPYADKDGNISAVMAQSVIEQGWKYKLNKADYEGKMAYISATNAAHKTEFFKGKIEEDNYYRNRAAVEKNKSIMQRANPVVYDEIKDPKTGKVIQVVNRVVDNLDINFDKLDRLKPSFWDKPFLGGDSDKSAQKYNAKWNTAKTAIRNELEPFIKAAQGIQNDQDEAKLFGFPSLPAYIETRKIIEAQLVKLLEDDVVTSDPVLKRQLTKIQSQMYSYGNRETETLNENKNKMMEVQQIKTMGRGTSKE